MRVITGTARGRRLETLAGNDVTRPTTESVKEAIFSMIQFEIEEKRVLDLFAGSGQLGIEALSRGASFCTLLRIIKRLKALFVPMLKNAAFLLYHRLCSVMLQRSFQESTTLMLLFLTRLIKKG